MSEMNQEEIIRALRNRTCKLEREGDCWTADERDRLCTLFQEGCGISDIAIRLQRTEPAVYQQIEKLDLYQRKSNPSRSKRMRRCCCLCDVCQMPAYACRRCLDATAYEEDNDDVQ